MRPVFCINMEKLSKNLIISNPSNPEFETLANLVLKGTPLKDISLKLNITQYEARKRITFYGLYPYWKSKVKEKRLSDTERRKLNQLKHTIKWELYEKFLERGLTATFRGAILYVDGVRVKVAGPRLKRWGDQEFYVIPFDREIRIYAIKSLSGKWLFYLPYVKRRNRTILWLNRCKEKKEEEFPTEKDIEMLKVVWNDKKRFDRYRKKGLFDEGGQYGRFRESGRSGTGGSERDGKWPWGKSEWHRPPRSD